MKKDTKESTPTTPATLTLETLSDFSEHLQEIDAKRVYISITNQPTKGPLMPSAEGSFALVVTARTDKTVLQYEETIRDVSHVDAFVRREDTEKKLNERAAAIGQELEALGFTIKKGRWTL